MNLLAVTACPTGIAHTYMAAEKLEQAATAMGHHMKVETQGSIGAENVLTDNDVANADAIIIAADKDVDPSRFVGKRVLTVGVSEGINNPQGLIERVQSAPVFGGGGGHGGAAAATTGGGGGGGKERSVVYKALMNGVSYMIPFVVVGGLLIAISLSIGGNQDPKGGLVIPENTFWWYVNQIGTIGFTLMIPILSGYIAYAIADRPGLVPGMIGGWIANTGSLYDSEAGAGFIGAIATGFLAGYLVQAIKKVKVPKFVQPIMPIIVIPVLATTALGLFFIYVIGRPIAWIFEQLTDWLGGMTGASAALLGIILGLMITFDMGGPVNKTAFLFGAGLVSKSPEVMGMCAAAIPVPPLGQGLATLIRRKLYSDQEKETGLAALFMGFFGITEGAIPFAAAHPARVIPANMVGGAVAGLIAGLATVTDAVPHGGPIVAVLGAVGGVPMFFIAVICGTVVTALVTVALLGMQARKQGLAGGGMEPALAGAGAGAIGGGMAATALDGMGATSTTGAGATAHTTAVDGEATAHAAYQKSHSAPVTSSTTRPVPKDDVRDAVPDKDEVLSGYLTEQTVLQQLTATNRDDAIRELVNLMADTGKVADKDALVEAALAREAQGTTGLGEEIAIPHAKTNAVTAPVVAFSRSDAGIDWGSMDGTLAKLIFMIAVPEAAAGDEHLRILAQLSRKLMDTDFRARLQGAGSDADILKILGEIQ
nr:fructose-specific PTS transporter subunit EIIC [Streptomyces coryli]